VISEDDTELEGVVDHVIRILRTHDMLTDRQDDGAGGRNEAYFFLPLALKEHHAPSGACPG